MSPLLFSLELTRLFSPSNPLSIAGLTGWLSNVKEAPAILLTERVTHADATAPIPLCRIPSF